MKKRIQVTITNDKGEVTFYNQCVVDEKDSKKIQIPLGKIIKEQKTGKIDEKQRVH